MAMKHLGIALVLCATAGGYVRTAQAAQIVVATSGECIDIPHGQTADGTALALFHCHGSPNQQWTVSSGQITGLGGVCLDVQGSQPNDGAQIIVVACSATALGQKWSIAGGQIVGIGGKCIDTLGQNISDRAPLVLAKCSSSSSQQWSLQ